MFDIALIVLIVCITIYNLGALYVEYKTAKMTKVPPP